MYPGYHRTFNNAAIKVLITEADMPDVPLSIGYSEDLTFKYLHIPYQPPGQKMTIYPVVTAEDAAPKKAPEQFTADMFPAGGWMGTEFGGY